GEGLELAGGADREQGAGDAVAAVLEDDEGARLVAAGAGLLHDVVAGEGRGAGGGGGGGLPGAGRGGRRGAAGVAGGAAGRGSGPIGPRRQRRISSRNSTAASWRTRMWSWSPAWTIVDPRGGIARSPRTMMFSSASRGRPSSRTGWPATASPTRTGNCIVSAP